jgi:ABC-2 type transport system ATP-binding protein
MSAAINIHNVSKNYAGIEAVRNVTFDVRKGEMFGLVGPDGAGKTSTIRMLCGLIEPDRGEIDLLGYKLPDRKKDIQKEIGYLSQRFSLYGDLTVDENIEFFAESHNVRDYSVRRDELLAFTRLTPFRRRLADKLSGGMKQKLALACSLIHRPKILFLDEPTTGVDPVSRRDFWKILSQLLKDGLTILMTTPYLDEAERCDRIAMMDKGKIIAIDDPGRIKASLGKIVLEIVCTPVRKAYETMKGKSNIDVQLFGDRINIIADSIEEAGQLLSELKSKDITIESKREITPSLESVFIHLIKESG